MNYEAFYQKSIEKPQEFWREEATMIDWDKPFEQVLDYSSAPRTRWFTGGTTNLCHNAVDRWLPTQAKTPALIAISTETDSERTYSFEQLHSEVNQVAAMLLSLGVKRGDRVLIYMPMVAEAVFVMLACARIGAVHVVVFGGFAASSLATRIDDATPALIVSTDAGSRGKKVVNYKQLLDEAIGLSEHEVPQVLLLSRGLVSTAIVDGRDVDYDTLRQAHLGAHVPVTWLEANDTSYILYTSGTTGKPKGIQRDVGGYAVALAASMKYIFSGKPGEVFFSTSDIGWVVGHSYIVYGPLLAGMATVLYEGLPTQPDPGVWWRIVEQYEVSLMFSAPTAIRVLKKYPLENMQKYDTSSLRTLFLAGEPLDKGTSEWISNALGVSVIDNYWQTETGWPILGVATGANGKKVPAGSSGVAVYGYQVSIVDDATGAECAANEKGMIMIEGPLPPGCFQTIFRSDQRFIDSYWKQHGDRWLYSSSDWGIRDSDNNYYVLGRSDDVINTAGHRLGTREIEECIAGHEAVSEVAVVGVVDPLKGQIPIAFVVPRSLEHVADDAGRAALRDALSKQVDNRVGSFARPSAIHFVEMLPKTRSGKLLRRSIQAMCEGREAGDISTLENPEALQKIDTIISANHG
ncbi:propionate--CoA ligase [Advenella kashmirensis]